jgi:hypothetical protein
VEQRHEKHQRRARGVREKHRPPRAEPLEELPRREPRDGETDQLGRHHERHLCR